MVRETFKRALTCFVLALCLCGGAWGQESAPGLKIQLTQKERAFLKKHPVLRFSGDPDWLPLEHFSPSGEYQGIVADYLKLIEKHSGLRFEIVPSPSWGRGWRA